ncbi:NAD(P)/FAD-dependent oxidoreductase [Culicoidibacter larvae]|uniref:NAD(P)/FAD-dependent oxidoreductase n=1 Tax=Culicoidibacter larvae TaxID=2579976 RepID=A0A5R8QF46_9FIRM|nr:NAD(P)/FAD-dependent oxidoreductase [Culicoidibacter larvae]TLG76659.1 NAD(P)/FAD-dependent oxidoreductase [Culicoidibacter larvae]
MKKTICIIGGGPAGMMAAISSKTANPDNEIHLLEKNPLLGRKLRATGGNRCNVTNNCSREELVAQIPGNGRFLYSVFDQFSNQDIIQFFESHGCPLKEEDHGRMFPTTDRSQTIIETLKKTIDDLGVHTHLETTVHQIDWKNKRIVGDKQVFPFDTLILTTGGVCAQHTGSTGDGLKFAKTLGHTITELFPTEVPLVASENFIHDGSLQGISLSDISLTLWSDKHKKVKTIRYDLVFTHFGISGPAPLRLSSFVRKQLIKQQAPVLVTIDCIPDISLDTIMANRKDFNEKQPATWIKQYVPSRLAALLVSLADLSADQKVGQLSPAQLDRLLQLLKAFPLTIRGTQGMERAFVTGGGISIKEVQPKTMESKLVPELYFAGEVLDIYGFTGGFNITAALATGYVAGLHSNKKA